MSHLKDTRKVALCANIWSRKGLTASYLGITAHFFTRSDHKRHTATIAVRRLSSPHTAERVEEIVDNVLTEWQIPRTKISAMLTDNGSNMIAAFRDWLDRMCSESEGTKILNVIKVDQPLPPCPLVKKISTRMM